MFRLICLGEPQSWPREPVPWKGPIDHGPEERVNNKLQAWRGTRRETLHPFLSRSLSGLFYPMGLIGIKAKQIQ